MTALLQQPHILKAYILLRLEQGLVQTIWYFDALVAFVVAFAFAYGLFSFFEKLFPPRPGNRPRAWTVPLLFAATAAGFHFFLDAFIASVLQALLDSRGLLPDQWLVGIAACVWAAGFAFLLVRALRNFRRLSKAAKALPDFSGDPVARAAVAATGAGESVRVKAGPPDSPIFSCGLLRAFIVVPANFAARYSSEERYAMLLHECIHIKSRDPLKLLCMAFLKAFLWFDPVAGHALKRMKAEMEVACDWAAVNAYRVNPAVYAALIVRAASEQRRPAPGFSDAYQLIALRLSHIFRDRDMLAPARVSRPGACCALAGLVSLAVAAALFFASLPPFQAARPEDIPFEEPLKVVAHAERNGVFARYAKVTVVRDE